MSLLNDICSAFQMDFILKDNAFESPESARIQRLLAELRDTDILKKPEHFFNIFNEGLLLSITESMIATQRNCESIKQVIKVLTEALNDGELDDSNRMLFQSQLMSNKQQMQMHIEEYFNLLHKLSWELRTGVRRLYNLKTRSIPKSVRSNYFKSF